MMRAVLRGVILAGASVLVAGCPTEANPPLDVAPGLRAEVLAAVAQPTAIAFAPDGRIFFTEKNSGAIRVIVDGVLRAIPVATLPVNTAGERGLLGIVLHPNFGQNRRIYVFYTRSDTGAVETNPLAVLDHRVVYLQETDNLAGPEVFVASLPAHGVQRIGGQLAFLQDDTLLVALGDQQNQDAAGDPSQLSGKILRYRDDGTIPADNPNPASAVYARGVRDPRGLAVDPISQTAFFADAMPSPFHEVNQLYGGRHYGWPIVIGLANNASERNFVDANPDYFDPLIESGTNPDPFAGVAFNPGGQYGTRSRDALFYGLRDAGRVFSVELTAARTATVSTTVLVGGFPPLRTIAVSPAGTLFVLTEMAVYRVVVVR